MKTNALGIAVCIVSSTGNAIGENVQSATHQRNILDSIHSYVPRSEIRDAVSRRKTKNVREINDSSC